MPESYLPILVMLVISIGFACIALAVPAVLGPRRRNPAKDEPYESGLLPFGDARRRFPVQFHLVAILFILFDVEVILLYPWAVVMKQLGLFGLIEILIFAGIILVGFYYALRSGAFNWQ
jgi:NADH-quinone oxidoreductase subunit A